MHDSSQWFKAEKVHKSFIARKVSPLFLIILVYASDEKSSSARKCNDKKNYFHRSLSKRRKTFPALVDVGSFKFSRSLFNGVLGNSFHTRKLFASQNKY